jgi:hypothetical protein
MKIVFKLTNRNVNLFFAKLLITELWLRGIKISLSVLTLALTIIRVVYELQRKPAIFCRYTRIVTVSEVDSAIFYKIH